MNQETQTPQESTQAEKDAAQRQEDLYWEAVLAGAGMLE